MRWGFGKGPSRKRSIAKNILLKGKIINEESSQARKK